jgi:tRNA-Thr(GGU) m(6)t(6)A37 methyltransferase TsaA
LFTPQPIGFVRSLFKEISAIPKGLGARGLTDIEGFSHLYVLWSFDQSTGFDLLLTPPSDDRLHGLFTTRAPRRPNPIALTVVELLEREENRLRVRGIDMLDGTPILDIKPYLSNVSAEKLRRGWLAEAEARNN